MNTSLRQVLAVTVFAVTALGGGAIAQPVEVQPDSARPVALPVETPSKVACPIPWVVTLTAPPPTAATPLATDFPAVTVTPEPNFGGVIFNRHFRHTFRWKPATDCCQYISGVLTLTFKSLQPGQSASSADAGNDSWSIWKNGAVQGSGALYTTFPFAAGATFTRTISLTPAMLAGDRLSFLGQDDTSVVSAKLQVTACCVRK